jgi:dTDP-L-rhamnose 4-epimerase
MLRVHLIGADTALGRVSTEALRAAGLDIATAPERADVVALLDDVHAGALVPAAEALVVRTAAFLDALPGSVKRLVVATGSEVYGEGPAECSACGHVRAENRIHDVTAPWEPRCPRCEGALTPSGIREEEKVQPASPFPALRLSREDLVRSFGMARGVETCCLRMFEVYGPGVAEGIFARMAGAIRAGKPPELAEDGLQTRDFVHVRDAAKAVVLAASNPRAAGHIFNVASGKGSRLSTVAAAMVMARGAAIEVKPTGEHRRGEARHLFAETMKIRHTLGWKPEVALTAGVSEAVEAS